MKLVSQIQSIEIKTKDILLHKRTGHDMTSEQFFEIDPQPGNTCPLIDKSLGQFENDMLKKILEARDDSGEWLKHKPKEDDNATCECFKIYSDNYREYSHFVDSIKNFKDEFKKLENKMEELRANCATMRQYGDDLKTILWESNSTQKDFDLLKIDKPDPKLNISDIIKTFDSVIKSISLPHNDKLNCKEWCDNALKDADLGTYIMTELKFNFNFSEYVEKSFDNYKKIVMWVEQLENQIQEKISAEQFFLVREQEINDYVEAMNKKYKNNLWKFVNESRKEIQKVSLDEKIKEYIKATENLNVAKKLKDYETLTNNLIEELFKIENHNWYEESLCDMYAEYFKKVDSLKNEMDNFGSTDGATQIDLHLAINPLRGMVNKIHSNIKELGPQVFTFQP